VIVYLNGHYVPYEQALIPVEDRGYVFGDGIYEVVWISGGRPYAFADHVERLRHSADGIELELPDDPSAYATVAERLLAENSLTDATMYLQITRGVAPRTHTFPAAARPTVLIIVRGATSIPDEQREAGRSALTVPDLRWGRCDIKSINLLPNILAKQAAAKAGAFEAILTRDGLAVEGGSSNFFAVFDGTLVTHPAGPRILGGITRLRLLRIAERLGLPVRLEAISLAELGKADELFWTSTTVEVMPCTQIDGRPAGGGRRGPIARRLQEELAKEIRG
jgi:D-alanine transaminase